jgi:hypothetical protein
LPLAHSNIPYGQTSEHNTSVQIQVVDVYTVAAGEAVEEGDPFITTTGFQGPKGETVRLTSVVDDGAMINAIDTAAYAAVRDQMNPLAPSRRQLRMANGAIVPSRGVWTGYIEMGGGRFKAHFEVFDSGRSWAVLIGKALLKQLNATHYYTTPEHIELPYQGRIIHLENEVGRTHGTVQALMAGINVALDRKQWEIAVGEQGSSPSRQVHTQHTPEREQNDVDSTMQHMKTMAREEDGETEGSKGSKDSRDKEGGKMMVGHENEEVQAKTHGGPGAKQADLRGDQSASPSRQVQPTNTSAVVELDDQPQHTDEPSTCIWAIGDVDPIFTRDTDPFKAERVAAIVQHVKIGDKLTAEQRARVIALVREFADTFALSVREVKAVDFAKFKLNIPNDTTFSKTVRHRNFTQSQQDYLRKLITELTNAGIVRHIDQNDIWFSKLHPYHMDGPSQQMSHNTWVGH